MHFQFSPYIIPLIAAALISGWVVVYSWAHRSTAGAIALALLALAITEWSLGYALEIAGTDLATKVFFGKAQYAGIVLTPLMWLIFSFNQANHARIVKHRAMGLLACTGGHLHHGPDDRSARFALETDRHFSIR